MWKDRNFSNIRGDSRSSGLSIRGERDDVPGSHEIVDQLLTDKGRRKISKKLLYSSSGLSFTTIFVQSNMPLYPQI